MTNDKPALRLAPISQWLASAGNARAWCCKRHLGMLISRQHLRSSRNVSAMDRPGRLIERHGMAIQTLTAFFESP